MSASVYDILLLVTALSVDTFAACFIYGADRVKIPLLSAVLSQGCPLLSCWLFCSWVG